MDESVRQVRPFDFRRPGQLDPEHKRAIDLVHERMARILTISLSAGMRCDCVVSVAGIDQLTYGHHVSDLANPSYVAVFTVEPLVGRGLLSMSLPLAMSVVDRFLGGTGAGPHPERPLTEIELGLLGDLTDRLLAGMGAGWQVVTPFTGVATRQESNPGLAKAAPAGTPVVVATLDVQIGEERGTVRFAIPFASIEQPLTAFTGHGVQAPAPSLDPDVMGAALTDRMWDVPVEVGMSFRPVPLTPEEIMSLEVGDVIPLTHPVGGALVLAAEGIPCVAAVPGRRGKRLAALVVDAPVVTDPDDSQMDLR